MKHKILISIAFFILIISTSFSQVDVDIENMTYLNGTPIDDCTVIDFEDNTSVTVQFGVQMTKPSTQVVGTGNLRIFTKKSSSDFAVQRFTQIVQEISWTNDETFGASLSITLSASVFNVSGGLFYAEYESSGGVKYFSCDYSIEKDQVPTFTISPSTTSISCGSTSPETFSVTNVYNSPGTLSYNWQVGRGWNNSSGNPVSSFVTTTNSVTLTPFSYPPSNVAVTPVLDGVNQPQLTSNVSLGGFNPTFYEVTGSNSLCSSAMYSVSNLPSDITVTSWDVSNTSVASITFSGNLATLTSIGGNGSVNVLATITNSCGQSKIISKTNVAVGAPTAVGPISKTGASSLNPGPVDSAAFSVSTQNILALNSISWVVYSNTNQNAASFFNIQPLGNGSTAILRANQNTPLGSYVMQARLTNTCGFMPVNFSFSVVRPLGSNPGPGGGSGLPVFKPRLSENAFKVYPNPSKDIVHIDVIQKAKKQTKDDFKVSGELFDVLGRPKLKIDMHYDSSQFSVAQLDPGVYILKIYINEAIETH
jgi:hypothetical protein